MTIERFYIHNAEDEIIGLDGYDTLQEARAATPDRQPWAIVAYQFEYSDSELVETSTGAMVWPPKKRGGAA